MVTSAPSADQQLLKGRFQGDRTCHTISDRLTWLGVTTPYDVVKDQEGGGGHSWINAGTSTSDVQVQNCSVDLGKRSGAAPVLRPRGVFTLIRQLSVVFVGDVVLVLCSGGLVGP